MPSGVPDSSAYVVDGEVSDILRTGGLTVIGGTFDEVGPRTGAGVSYSTSTGARVASLAEVAGGTVSAVESDGSGGFYIGGDFTHVGGQPWPDIAHIKADGSLDTAFDPDPDSSVSDIVVSGSTVYVAGGFVN